MTRRLGILVVGKGVTAANGARLAGFSRCGGHELELEIQGMVRHRRRRSNDNERLSSVGIDKAELDVPLLDVRLAQTGLTGDELIRPRR